RSQRTTGLAGHGMTEFGEGANDCERIAATGLEETSESGGDIGRRGALLLAVGKRAPARCRQPWRCGGFLLVECARPLRGSTLVDTSRAGLRGDLGLEIGDQSAGFEESAIGAVAQALEQRLEEKQITEGQRLVFPSGRHVKRRSLQCGENFAWRLFEILIEIG